MDVLEIFRDGNSWLPWVAVTAIATGGSILVGATYLHFKRLKSRLIDDGTTERQKENIGMDISAEDESSRTASRAVVVTEYKKQQSDSRVDKPQSAKASEDDRKRKTLIAYLERISELRLRLDQAVSELEDLRSKGAGVFNLHTRIPASIGFADSDIEYLNREAN